MKSFRSMVLWACLTGLLVPASAGLASTYTSPPSCPGTSAYALAIGRSSCGGDVLAKRRKPLAQCNTRKPLRCWRPVPQGVELGAQGLAHRGCDGREFLGELVERVAEAVAECTQGRAAHALDGAIEPIREDAPTPIGRLVTDAAR